MKDKKEIANVLKYDLNNNAPELIAKGAGYLATKIKEIAKESNIPIYVDEKLSKQLYNLSIGEEIPPQLYQVVAEVLAFIANLDNKEGGN